MWTHNDEHCASLCLVFHFLFYLLLVSFFGPIWFFLSTKNTWYYSVSSTHAHNCFQNRFYRNNKNKCTLLNTHAYLFVFFFQGELLFLYYFQLVSEVEFRRFLLKFCEFVFVFGNFLQCRFYTENGIHVNMWAKTKRELQRNDNTHNFPRKSLTWLFNSLI